MAILGFGDKKKEKAANPTETVPTQAVLTMRQRGLSNNQIVQSLQKNGYKTHQIFDAMNQADLKATGQPIAELEMPPVQDYPMPQPMEPMPEPRPQPRPQPRRQPMQQQMQMQQPEPQLYEEEPADEGIDQNLYEGAERIEEIAEAIIDEKWNELLKQVTKILEWKNAMENQMNVMQQQFADLRADYNDLQKSVIDKVSEYDRNITSVGTEIKAMEQVFQKVLPSLTENVNTLSRITGKMKAVEKKIK